MEVGGIIIGSVFLGLGAIILSIPTMTEYISYAALALCLVVQIIRFVFGYIWFTQKNSLLTNKKKMFW